MKNMNYDYLCPKCKEKLKYGVTKCPKCKTSIDWSDENDTDTENVKQVKINTRLNIGIILIVFNIVMALIDTVSCKKSYITQDACSFTKYEYGLLYMMGRFIFLIIGVFLIYRWWRNPKFKEVIIDEHKDAKSEDNEDYDEDYDEDLEDMYNNDDDIIKEDETDDEISIEEDEDFNEDFEFSYDKVKEVLKKIGYTNFATFRKEVYENKHIKRKKFENKEDECNYLVSSLGYDDFEDFYISNMKK